MSSALEERLQAAQVVPDEVLEDTLEHHHTTGMPLGDALVSRGAISEKALLLFLSEGVPARCALGEHLARVEIARAVLDRLPCALAERHSLLPVRFDERSGVLTLVCPDPHDKGPLQEAKEAAGARELVKLVALESGIQAAIRKHYLGDADAFTPEGKPAIISYRCGGCAGWVSPRDFQCGGCERLINPEVRDRSEDSSVVRAFLAMPHAPLSEMAPAPTVVDSQGPTRVRRLFPTDQVPQIAVGLEAFERPLHPFEAYVLSHADGTMSIAEISDVCGMGPVEVQSVMGALIEKQIIRLHDPQRKRASSTSEPAPDAATSGLLEQAALHERSGNTEAAIETLMQGIGKLERPAPLYNRLALILLHQRDDPLGAARLLRLAVQLEPQNLVYHQNLARVLALGPEG